MRLRSFRPKFPAFFEKAQRQLIAESDCGVATLEARPEGVVVTMQSGSRYLVCDLGVGELEPVKVETTTAAVTARKDAKK